jgi:hypothetical protein
MHIDQFKEVRNTFIWLHHIYQILCDLRPQLQEQDLLAQSAIQVDLDHNIIMAEPDTVVPHLPVKHRAKLLRSLQLHANVYANRGDDWALFRLQVRMWFQLLPSDFIPVFICCAELRLCLCVCCPAS